MTSKEPTKRHSKRSSTNATRYKLRSKSRKTGSARESATSLANLPVNVKHKIFSMVPPKSKRIASIFSVQIYDHANNTVKRGYQLRPAPNLAFDGSRGIQHSVLGGTHVAAAHQRTSHTMNNIKRIIRNNLTPLFTNITQEKGKEPGRINLYANFKKIPPALTGQYDPVQGPNLRRRFANYDGPLNWKLTAPSKNFMRPPAPVSIH